MFDRSIRVRASRAWVSSDPRWLDLPIPSEGMRQKKMMSQAAWLAYQALHALLKDAGWSDGRQDLAYFLGVGASGSTAPELNEIVRASLVEKEFSLRRFGGDGLAACNPLFAFQLMNGFTLCHGSILEKVQGANAALYSRGVGTVAALAEACFALEEGTATRAIAGGSDCATHPVTQSELLAEGRIAAGLRPTDGVGLLALTAESSRSSDLPRISSVRFYGGAGRGETSVFAKRALEESRIQSGDEVYIYPWGNPTRASLLEVFPTATDLGLELGESLAAGPATAWVMALERMRSERALVVTAGIDGGVGAVVFERGGP